MAPEGPGLREVLAAAGVFTVATLALTWPGARHPFARVIGSADGGDLFISVWNLWWARMATRGHPFLYTDFVFHPYGASLTLHDFGSLLAILSVPLQRWGLAFAYNVLVWLTFVLSGLAAWLLGRAVTGSRAAGYVTGALFAFGSYRFAHLPEHLALLGTFGMPAYAWALVRVVQTEGRRRTPVAAAAGLLGLNLFLSHTYFVYCLLLGSVAGAWLCTVERWPARRVMRAVAAPLAIGTLPALGLLGLAVRHGAFGEQIAYSAASSRIFNGAALSDYVTPSVLHPVRRFLTGTGPVAFFGDFEERTVYLGWVPLALTLLGLPAIVRSASARIVLAVGVLAAVLSLEPVFRDTVLVLQSLVGQVWMLHHLRVPTRLGVLVLLAVSVLAAQGAASLLGRIRGRGGRAGATALLLGLIVFEHLAVPVPTTALGVPEVYRRLGAVPGDFAILTLPLGWRVRGAHGVFDPGELLFQTAHEKRIVGGYVSRPSMATLARIESEPVVAAILRLQGEARAPDPGELAALRPAAAALAERWRIRFVVVRKRSSPVALRESTMAVDRLDRLARALFRLEPWLEDDHAIAYRVLAGGPRAGAGTEARRF